MKNITFCLLLTLSFIGYSQTTFAPKVTLSSTGAGPYTIDSGLIDGDNYADIVLGSFDGNTIEYYKNNQDGTFGSKVLISNSLTGISDLKLVDLNDDTFLDILACGGTNGKLVWFSNDGTGTFSSEIVISSNVGGANNIAVGTIDANTSIDIVVSAYSVNEVLWFSNDGSGNFTEGTTKVDNTLNGPTFISLKDVDDDGDLDALITTSAFPPAVNSIELFTNEVVPNGTVTFTKNADPISGNKVYLFSTVFEDVQDINNNDFFASDFGFSSQGAIYRYQENGSGYSETEVATGLLNPAILKIADLDSDNEKDLIASSGQNNGNSLAWFKNNGDGTYASNTIIDATQSATYVFTVQDFDLDGDMDIASLSYNQAQLNYFENQRELLNVTDLLKEDFKIYPNPARHILNFKTSIQDASEVTITDISGKLVYRSRMYLQDGIDVSAFQNGYYILSINGNSHYKFVKQ